MNEFWRKTFHVIFGLGIAAGIWYGPTELVLPILAAGLLVGLGLIDLVMRGGSIPIISHLLTHLERPGVFPGKGAFYFVFSAFVTLIFFPASVTALSVLVLAVLDGMVTILGLRYGRIRIINHKSIEGTGGAILVTFGILLMLVSPLNAVIIAVVAGIIELVSPIDDNLLIPPVVALLVTIMPW